MQSKNLMTAFVVFVLVTGLTIGTIFYQNASSNFDGEEDSKQPEAAVIDPSPVPASEAQNISYKDGTYSTDGVYLTPENQEKIGVTLTLKDNVIIDANVEGKGILSTSQKFQAEFISGYKEQVIGKSINEIKLTKVAGSSLTPKGFNDAINKIKEQAKV